MINWQRWHGYSSLEAKDFTCGFCGKYVGGHAGYFVHPSPPGMACIYICPNCGLPTFFFGTEQHPGPLLGREIRGLHSDIDAVYKELRNTAKNASYTATSLLGRKLIMHIAVEAGAKEGQTFEAYVNYLSDNHYLPPNADKLLTYMRRLGNEKNHEIKLGQKEEADRIIKFVEALLYFVYELNEEFADKPDKTTPKADTGWPI